jgi:hypothetical protein
MRKAPAEFRGFSHDSLFHFMFQKSLHPYNPSSHQHQSRDSLGNTQARLRRVPTVFDAITFRDERKAIPLSSPSDIPYTNYIIPLDSRYANPPPEDP